MSQKRITTDDLYREILSLRSGINLLRESENENKAPTNDDNGVKFLLTEFNEIGEFWRHTDLRIESTVNYYLTASAAITTLLVYFFQQSTNLRSFIGFMAAVALAFFLGGTVLIHRVISSSITIAEYRFALNLIRRYFVDSDKSIQGYVFLPIAKGSLQDTMSDNDVSVRVSGYSFLVLKIWVSFLFGFIFGIVLWLLLPQLSLLIIGLISFVMLIIAYFIYTFIIKRQIAVRTHALLERKHKRSVLDNKG